MTIDLTDVALIPSEEKYHDARKLTDLSFYTNSDAGDWSAPGPDDRACHHLRGMAFYFKSAYFGIRFPLSSFIVGVLTRLKVPPGQLTGVAWCALNSFEQLFQDFADELQDLSPSRPSLAMFLHLYSFMVTGS